MPRIQGLAVVLIALAIASATTAFTQDAPPAPDSEPAPATEAPAEPPPDPEAEARHEAALQEAKDAFKVGSWAPADDAALRALAEQPKDLEALYIAGTSERQLGKLPEAEVHLKTLVETQTLFPLGHFQLAYVLFLEADALVRDGNFDAAKAHYVEAAEEFGKEVERDPTHVASISSRAIALARAGKIDEAATAHEAWIAAIPDKNDPVVSLAAAYAVAGRSSDAMATLDRLPEKDPNAVFDSVMAVANVFVAKKDWGAAVPFLEKAASTNPAATSALALLTEACARAGLVNDAVTHLQKLLTMEPTPDEAEAVGEAIKAVVGNGTVAPSVPGVEPPAVLKIPTPRYPKGQDTSVQTDVRVLVLIQKNGAVGATVLVPNRIWKDIRSSGFEAEALDVVKRGKFTVGTKNGQPADLWIVVVVKFDRA